MQVFPKPPPPLSNDLESYETQDSSFPSGSSSMSSALYRTKGGFRCSYLFDMFSFCSSAKGRYRRLYSYASWDEDCIRYMNLFYQCQKAQFSGNPDWKVEMREMVFLDWLASAGGVSDPSSVKRVWTRRKRIPDQEPKLETL